MTRVMSTKIENANPRGLVEGGRRSPGFRGATSGADVVDESHPGRDARGLVLERQVRNRWAVSGIPPGCNFKLKTGLPVVVAPLSHNDHRLPSDIPPG